MEGSFAQRLQHYVDQIAQYDDPTLQELARALLPVEEFEENAAIALAKRGTFIPRKEEQDHFVLLQLLYWFKTSFKWVNSPSCDFCASETHPIGMAEPTADDLQFGANRVEIHSCNLCGTISRFPRYNSPAKLMETQSGRCGEWANCFTFYCVALGYQARLVLDFTDHVWTECYSSYLGRWMHLDPCEASYDTPLLYEQGWGKKLNYVIAISKDGVYDVTRRYTRKWPEVLSRRNLVSEDVVQEELQLLTALQRSKLESGDLDILEQRDKEEFQELSESQTSTGTSDHLPGRQSGSNEWREARGEMGSEVSEINSSKCPVRRCVDEHVGKLYQAIGMIRSQETSPAKEVLGTIYDILLKLKKEPFKTRTLKLGPEEDCILQTKGGAALVDAIGMEQDTDGNHLVLKEPPGKVALALVVALEIVGKLTKEEEVGVSSALLMLEGKRLCGGSTYASGEQLRTGTADAAFDGHYSTKWEEPEGAKGATLVYHVQDSICRRIIGYELTSANDCPERDPMDWLVEGSTDGGKTWQLLDKQSGQFFEDRFQRRCFRVASESQQACNVLRIRFTAVRDATETSRLQVSCIDFYED